MTQTLMVRATPIYTHLSTRTYLHECYLRLINTHEKAFIRYKVLAALVFAVTPRLACFKALTHDDLYANFITINLAIHLVNCLLG